MATPWSIELDKEGLVSSDGVSILLVDDSLVPGVEIIVGNLLWLLGLFCFLWLSWFLWLCFLFRFGSLLWLNWFSWFFRLSFSGSWLLSLLAFSECISSHQKH